MNIFNFFQGPQEGEFLAPGAGYTFEEHKLHLVIVVKF